MNHPIPPEVFEQHVVALGKTGAGKSYALRGLVEQLLGESKRVCIVDPKGDWWGLKSSATGKTAGFPVVIFGGEHGDVPLNEHVGGQVAELVATGNRPCILDFGGWHVGPRTRFWIDFAAGLFKHNRGPLWLVMDEVHNFAPQGKILDPDAGRCLHWTNRLASEGRGKGIRILMASQRPQKVHKDTLTCAETLIAMRVIHPLDRGAVKDWMDGAGDPAKASEVLTNIASLQRGQAFVWSPEIKFFGQVTFTKITTFDSFATPTDDAKTTPKGWASVDLDEVKERLCQVVEEAKANDPAELKKEVARLKRELEAAHKEEPEKELVELPAITREDWDRVEAAAAGFDQMAKAVSDAVEVAREAFRALNGLSGVIAAKLQQKPLRPIAPSAGQRHRLGRLEALPHPTRRVPAVVDFTSNGTLDGAQQKILDTAAMLRTRGLTPNREMMARWMDIHPNGGRYNSNLAYLRSAGLLDGCELTPEGQARAHTVTLGITGAEDVLDGSQVEIIKVLEAGQELTREELAERLGIHPNGGRYNSNLARLRTMGLIPERGRIKLTPEAHA